MSANRRLLGLAALALVLLLGLVLVVVRPQWNSLARRFFPETIETGFVFIDGHYVTPPYTVNETAGNLSINGTLVRPLPLEAKPPTAPKNPAPAVPQSARDLVKVALAHLRDKGVTDFRNMSPDLHREVVDLIKTYPAAASVSDDGAEIVVTDRSGEEAGLLLDAPLELPREALVANQAARAEGWKRVLKLGGVLLLVPGAEVEIPSQKSASFLTSLLAVFDQAESARLKQMTDLVRVPQLAGALLKAGAPPASLRERLPSTPPAATRQALKIVNQSATFHDRLLVPLSDEGSHKLSLTPGQDVAYFFQTIILESGEEAAAKEAARLHGYYIVVYEADYRVAALGGTVKGPGTSTIQNFLGTSGAAGILYIATHGGKGSIDIEEYTDEDEATAAYLAYKRGTPPVTGLRFESVPGSTFTDHWAVAISDIGVRAQWKGPNTIVELTTCWGWTMHDAFRASGAREFLGAIREVIEADPVKVWNEDFWGRLAGTLVDGTRRNVGDAAADVFAGTIFRYDGEKLTVLSPAVAHVSPADNTTVGVGWVVNAEVVFDSPINTVNNLPIELTGTCAPDFVSSYSWDATGRTLSLTFTTRGPGRVAIRAVSSTARSDSNSVALDGNDGGRGKSHVAGNGDDYVWQLNCDPNLLIPTSTASPTPSATPSETPSPTATPTGTASSTPTVSKTATRTATPTRTATLTATGTPTRGTATATATATPTPTAPPCAPPPGTNPGPFVCKFVAEFVQAVFSTYYYVTAFDPSGAPLSYVWSNSNQCGVFRAGNSPQARWIHPDIPGGCPVQAVHPGTIMVVITSADGEVRCIYPNGSAPGNVAQCVKQ